MERPRLRALEAVAVEHNGGPALVLRDPSGLSDAVATLAPAAVLVLQLCDGQTTRDEICSEYARRHGSQLTRSVLDRLLDQLDGALLLDSERFRSHAARVRSDFAQRPARPAYLAGRSYPADASTLRSSLAATFVHPDGPGAPQAGSGDLPHAIIAPHIDFARGGPAYAWAYHALAEARDAPELVIVLGTDHRGSRHPMTLTRKHFETPLGALETDGELVDELVSEIGRRGGDEADRLFEDEDHHRCEHSIEFQMVWVRYLLPDTARVKVLPILCGSLQEFVAGSSSPHGSARVAMALEALTAIGRKRRTLFIAGADLAHVGPRFGDDQPLNAADREALERDDRAALNAAAAGDAGSWFACIEQEQDRRRVCGLSPIFALLSAARPGQGALLTYRQCPADDDGGSLVTIASMVYRKR